MAPRERWLALAVGALLGLWVLDAAALQPLLRWLDDVRKETRQISREAGAARILVERKDRLIADWRAKHAAGLAEDDSGLRFRLQQAVAEAAKQSGCAIDSLGSGQRISASAAKAVGGATYDTVRFTLNAQGTLAEATGFLGRLTDASVPLRIERCELSARDARKDQLDLTLTLSSRLLAPSARAGRGVPAGTAPWISDGAGSLSVAALVDAKPFAADRRRGSAPAAAAAASPTGPGTWAAVGIVRGAETLAFFRHLGDGREQTVKPGDTIDEWTVRAIDGSTVALQQADTSRAIAVGTDLAGAPVPMPVRASAVVATTTTTAAPALSPGSTTAAATPTPFAVPVIPTGDATRDAILQRLRERRNRGN